MTEVWWRTRWMDAVWESDLKPLEKLVAAVFADHARDQRTVWVTLGRLIDRSGLSRDAANRALQGVRDEGWLVVMEKGRQHKPTVYLLQIPDASSTGDVPLSSTADGPLTQSSSTSPDTSSTSPDTSSTGDVLNQSSIKDQHQSSSSSRRKHASHLLGWDEEDERLDLIDDFLAENNVKSAKKWMDSCHANGDLEPNLLTFLEERKLAVAWSDTPWPGDSGLKGRLLQQFRGMFSDPEDADQALAYEAEAMGMTSCPDAAMVIRSAITTQNWKRQQAKEMFE